MEVNSPLKPNQNKMYVRLGKRFRKRFDNRNSNLNISLNGAISEQVKSHKLFGFQLDQHLNFDIQMEVLFI